MDNRLDNAAFIKTTMMLLIVLYHSLLFFGGNWFTIVKPMYTNNYIYNFALWLNTFHVQTFIMISGYLYYYLKTKCGKYNSFSHFAKKKCQRLLLPYIFTALCWVIPISLYFFKYNFKNIFLKYILMSSPDQLWFLVTLFNIFIIFHLAFKKIKVSKLVLLIVIFLSITLGGVLGYFDIEYFQIASSFKYGCFFYLGCYLYKYGNSLNFKKIIGLTITAILLIILNNINIINNIIIEKVLLQVLSIIEVILVYYVCTYIIKNNKINLNNKIYKLLESNSFGIYLFHQQIIFFCIVLLNGLVTPTIQIILTLLIALILSLLISILLKKNRITKYLFGL